MMLFLTLIFVCLLLCLLLCVLYIKRNTTEPPTMAGRLPIIGHLHKVIFSDNVFELIKEMAAACNDKGGVAMLDLAIRKVCVVSDPEDCLTVANMCLDKDETYALAKSFIGNGLLVSDVPTWKKHRKLLNPAFSQHVLNGFVETFNSQARALVQMFDEDLGRPIDHEHFLRINNLETIYRTSTGIYTKKNGDLQKQYIALIAEVLSIYTKKFQQFWLQSNFIFSFTKWKKREDEIVATMRKLSNEIIEIKRAEKKNNNHVQNKSGIGNAKPFMDLMLDLAEETGCFTDEEIRDETDNIIIAAYDTTASMLTFVLTLLGSYPDIQDKVYKEVMEIIRNSNGDLQKGDLSKLIYTEAVLKETLRLYPAAGAIGRYSDKPVKLKNYTIKANTGYFLVLYAVHRHSMWGPDAEVYRPERWLDTDTLPDLNYFAGFSLGKRNCIGKTYAMMYMKIVVAHMIRQYRISADVTKMKISWDVMARPHGSGHYVTLHLRK